MNKPLEEAFHQKMVEVYEKAKTECHYNAVRFHQMVQKHRGLPTAKMLLASKQHPEGLTSLWELKRLDISMEATLIQEPWCSLFSPEELAIAKKRLKELGYTPAEQERPPAEP
jgi:hypothetical protein